MNLSSTRSCFDDQGALPKDYHPFLEMMFSILIIALAVSAFFEQIPLIVGKTRLTSLMAPVSEGRIKVIEHHAFSGDWLDEAESGEKFFLKGHHKKTERENADSLSAQVGYIQKGAVHIEVHNRKRNTPAMSSEWWSIRPAVTENDAPTILWVCGSRSPPTGFHAHGENLTTIPLGENFWFCRDKER